MVPQSAAGAKGLDTVTSDLLLLLVRAVARWQNLDMERYAVRIGKEDLGFSACHFITLGVDDCESLHGHSFRVAAEVEAILDQDHIVFDFVALRRIVRGILMEIDHRVLIAQSSPHFRIEQDERSVKLTSRTKRWSFPRGDCVLLPLENTTSELLARWISRRLREGLDGHARASGEALPSPLRLRIELEDSPGQAAIHETLLELP